MYSNAAPLSSEGDKLLRVLPQNSFEFAAFNSSVMIGLSEFFICSRMTPIAFAQISENFYPVVLLGINDGENLFVGTGGEWTGAYIPAAFRHYPFVLAPSGKENALSVCIERNPTTVSDTEGHPLFLENGEQSPFTQKVLATLKAAHDDQQQGQLLGSILHENKLFAPLALQLGPTEAHGQLLFEGMFRVDDSALNELNDAAFLDLRKKGALPLIYAHLNSLSTFQQLIERKNVVQ